MYGSDKSKVYKLIESPCIVWMPIYINEMRGVSLFIVKS